MKTHELIEKVLKLGGAGSGHYGHRGIPGQVGGSAASGSGGMLGTYDLTGDRRPVLYKAVGANLRMVSSGSRGIGPGGSPDTYEAKITKKLDGFLEEVRGIEGLSKFDLDDINSAQMQGKISETTLFSLISKARESLGIKGGMYR